MNPLTTLVFGMSTCHTFMRAVIVRGSCMALACDEMRARAFARASSSKNVTSPDYTKVASTSDSVSWSKAMMRTLKPSILSGEYLEKAHQSA
jgi:hypothetical protein